MKRALRTAGMVAVVVAVAFGYVYLAENKGYALKTGTEAPGFRLPSLAGGEMDLASWDSPERLAELRQLLGGTETR